MIPMNPESGTRNSFLSTSRPGDNGSSLYLKNFVGGSSVLASEAFPAPVGAVVEDRGNHVALRNNGGESGAFRFTIIER